MLPRLLLLFIGVPLLEMAILIKLGEMIGFWPTIGLVVVTGIIGAFLARMQGLLTLTRIQRELAEGRVPASEMLDGLLILIGGAVLLTPGLLTDLFGFSLLLPVVRRWLKSWIRRKFSTIVDSRSTHIHVGRFDSPYDRDF